MAIGLSVIGVVAPSRALAVEAGSISGTVYAANGTTALQGVQVSANTDAGWGWATTGADGTYTISDLPASEGYRVRFDPSGLNQQTGSGYMEEYFDGATQYQSATLVNVSSGESTTGVDATLDQGGTISGTVYAADGTTALQGVQVSADAPAGWGYATTAEDGSYSITGIPASDAYRVRFDPSGLNQTSGSGYVAEYFNGAAQYQNATLVKVTSGDTTMQVNATLDLGGSISGTVYDAEGTTPLANVNVSADTDGSWGSATTATDGTYTITGLRASDAYRVRFDPYSLNQSTGSGFVAEYFDGAAQYEGAALVQVATGASTTGVNATLDVGGSISGTVYAADGTTPLANVSVSANAEGSWGSANTASDGTYTITGLRASDAYRVRFDPYSLNQAGGLSYVAEYFDGVAEYQNATAVKVTSGAVTTNINASLDLGGSISGTVHAADGTTPLGDVQVSASGDGTWGSVTTGQDGTYTISGLRAGGYRIRFDPYMLNQSGGSGYVAEYFEGALRYDDAALVTVTSGAVTPDVNATLELAGSISGTVYAADGTTPLRDVQVSAGDGVGWGYTQTREDGSYTINGLPVSDAYRVQFNPYSLNQAGGGGYVAEYFNGVTRSQDATLVKVTSGAVTSGVNATLDSGGTISGKVYASDGTTALAGVSVSAEATGGQGWANTGADGSYTINGLASGDYRVKFSAYSVNLAGGQGYVTEYFNGTTRLDEATLVKVTSGAETTDVNATLDAGGTISGKVMDAEGTAMAGVPVVVDGPDGAFGDATTKADGTYVINGLATGDYLVSFGPTTIGGQLYAFEYFDGTTTHETATLVKVTQGIDTPSINATLETTTVEQIGWISGTVNGPDGKTPLPGIEIGISWPSGDGGYAVSTDGNGTFRFSERPGCYAINFRTDEYNASHDPDLLGQYYKNKADFPSATPVCVVAGQETSNINAVLQPVNNTAPTLEAIESQTIDELTTLTLTITATDAESQPLTFSLKPGTDVPEGASITEAGVFTWTPTETQGPGEYSFTVVVSDGTLTAEATFTVTVKEVLQAMTPGTPTITGTPQAGATLTVHPGTWTPLTAAFTYQWFSGDVEIDGATSSTYVVQDADAGLELMVKVTGTAEGFESATAASEPVTVSGLSTFVTSAPTIKGAAKVGATLTASVNTRKWVPQPATLTYQWSRVCSTSTSEIPEATLSTYVVTADDIGCRLIVTVTGSQAGYTPAEVSSTATALVKPPKK